MPAQWALHILWDRPHISLVLAQEVPHRRFGSARTLGEGEVVLIGNLGERVEGTLDLRGETTLSEVAAIISQCRCYIGIDSGPMWIAGSLQVPTVGVYGTDYLPACEAIFPHNPNAVYLKAEGSPKQVTAQAALNALSALELRREYGTGVEEGVA